MYFVCSGAIHFADLWLSFSGLMYLESFIKSGSIQMRMKIVSVLTRGLKRDWIIPSYTIEVPWLLGLILFLRESMY